MPNSRIKRFMSFCPTLIPLVTSKPSVFNAAAMSRASFGGFFKGGADVYAPLPITSAMRFDDHQGTEHFWLVWSASPVKELEAVTGAVNDRDLGEIKDEAKARTVRDFLKQYSSTKPEVTKDSAKKQSVVKAKADVLVNAIELEHH